MGSYSSWIECETHKILRSILAFRIKLIRAKELLPSLSSAIDLNSGRSIITSFNRIDKLKPNAIAKYSWIEQSFYGNASLIASNQSINWTTCLRS
jgi:hypothetical protein